MSMQEMYVLVPVSDKICWLTGIQVLTNRNSINLVKSHMEACTLVLITQLKLINVIYTLFQKNFTKDYSTSALQSSRFSYLYSLLVYRFLS